MANPWTPKETWTDARVKRDILPVSTPRVQRYPVFSLGVAYIVGYLGATHSIIWGLLTFLGAYVISRFLIDYFSRIYRVGRYVEG